MASNLTQQQQYLLNRLPGRYDIKEPEVVEPAAVKAARKVIEAHAASVSKSKCDYVKKYKASMQAAREAIYFSTPEVALEKVRSFEKEFPTKCTC